MASLKGGQVRFEIATDLVPERIVVDPEVEPLFAGRKRCEKGLDAP